MIRHQLDFVLSLIDDQTDHSVSGVNRFWINDRPIKTTKIVGEHFIFSNLMSDHVNVDVNDPSKPLTLKWHNDQYLPLYVNVRRKKYFSRVLPSRQYPLKHSQQWVDIEAKGAQKLFVLNRADKIKYHLMAPVSGETVILIMASYECRLEERYFLLSEGEQSEVVRLVMREGQMYGERPLMNTFTEMAQITELVEASQSEENGFFLLKNLSHDEEANKVCQLNLVAVYDGCPHFYSETLHLEDKKIVTLERK